MLLLRGSGGNPMYSYTHIDCQVICTNYHAEIPNLEGIH